MCLVLYSSAVSFDCGCKSWLIAEHNPFWVWLKGVPSGITTYGCAVLTLDSRFWIFLEHFVCGFSLQPAKIITTQGSQKKMCKICPNGIDHHILKYLEGVMGKVEQIYFHNMLVSVSIFQREASSLFQSAVKNSSSLTPPELLLLIPAFSTGVIPGLDHRQYTGRISSGFLLLICLGWRTVLKG